MARKDINIGVEGNDGTGDSIRASFKKVNENFVELYAVFGLGGRISFTTLSDTPDSLTPQTIPIVNNAGTEIMLAEIASDADNSIIIEVIDGVGGTPGKIKFVSTFGAVVDDVIPRLGGPLYAANNVIAGVNTSQEALDLFNTLHETNLTLDSVVLTIGAADQRYLTTEVPVTVEQEPTGTNHYTWKVFDYISTTGEFEGSLRIISHLNEDQEEIVTGHGLTSAWNGTAVRMQFLNDIPTQFSDYLTANYYIRILDAEHIWLFDEDNREYSYTTVPEDAIAYHMNLTGIILSSEDVHQMVLASYDTSLSGNYLANQMVPRKDLVFRHGDTMTGALYMPDHPGDLAGVGSPNGPSDLQVATKLYVDRGSAWTSPDSLYVSTSGDDTMSGVPVGKEGSSQSFAFRTINAAAKHAETLIKNSTLVPGPNRQKLTYTSAGETLDTYILDYNVLGGTENAQYNYNIYQYLSTNREFILAETIAYIKVQFPNFEMYEVEYKDDLQEILDSVIMDMSLGSTANFLVTQAAKSYYSELRKRRIVYFNTAELTASVEFMRDLASQCILQDLLHQGRIESITRGDSTLLTLELTNTNYVEGTRIRITGIPDGSEWHFLTDNTYFIKPTDNTLRSFELYLDAALAQPVNTNSLSANFSNPTSLDYHTGIIFQAEEPQSFNSSIPTTDLASRRNDVNLKFEIILDILTNGLTSEPERISYGQPYQIYVKNAGAGFIDQTNLAAIEAQAGKLIVGKYSGSIARIIRFQNNVVSVPKSDPLDPSYTELNPTVFDLQMLSDTHFEVGEPLDFAHGVYEKNININVESGIYEEDFPIRLTDNVSLTGEDKRKVLVKPRPETKSNIARISQSSYANLYMYRDTNFDGIAVTKPGVEDFENQIGDPIGTYGYHYITDPSKEINVGTLVNIDQNNSTAVNILENNLTYIATETVSQFKNLYPFITNFVDTDMSTDVEFYVSALIKDLTNRTNEYILEFQGYLYENETRAFPNSDSDTINYINIARDLCITLVQGNTPTTINSSRLPLIQYDNNNIAIAGEDGVPTLIADLTTLSQYLFSPNYNPPLRNDKIDMFMLNDGTIVQNITCIDYEGFAFVFDPNGQVLTRSPEVKNCITYSRSKNGKTYSGGMYLDAYVANKPYIITAALTEAEDLAPNQYDPADHLAGSLTLEITSPAGQGLFISPPVLPAPFFIEGRHYQVNAYSNYDRLLGAATIYLDDSSNAGYGYVATQFADYTPGEQRQIAIQTAGNRAVKAESVDYYNDMGYGVVATNGAYTEQKLVNTYYCYAGFFTNHGAEIRSISSSNTYGSFGIVAEGADQNEIPDQVESKYTMVMPAIIDGSNAAWNLAGDSVLYAKGFTRSPFPKSIVSINHNGATNSEGVQVYTLNYFINAVLIETSSATQSDIVYRLSITPLDISDEDYFGLIQATIPAGTLFEYRDSEQHQFTGIRSQEKLNPRPATSINFDESDSTSYRTMAFATTDVEGNNLPADETRVTFERGFDYVKLEIAHSETDSGYGDTLSDSKTIINKLLDNTTFADANRVVGKVFAWAGRLHRITSYYPIYTFSTNNGTGFATGTALTSSSGGTAFSLKGTASFNKEVYNVTGTWNNNDTVSGQTLTSDIAETDYAIVEFEYVTGSDIAGDNNAGLRLPISTNTRHLFAGNEPTTAEITINISITRATGHDFKEIGTGSYNDSNYPNILYGDPVNPTAVYYTNAEATDSAEVWEKGKGKCFWVSTDQFGFFRVGQYFNVDQGTGAISFSGNVGISNASSLGFVQGVTINEFSVDDSFTDLSSTAVPTEKAVASYINKVLGYNFSTDTVFAVADGRIGPGFLPLNGHLSNASMTGNLMMGGNKISDLDNPQNGDDAATKAYVDDNSTLHNEILKMRDFATANQDGSMGANELLFSSGNRIIYVNIPSTGSFSNGMNIRNTADPAVATIDGTVIQSIPYTDEIFGDIIKVIYAPDKLVGGRSFNSNIDAQVFGGTYTSGSAQLQATFISPIGSNSPVGGSYPEITNATMSASSDLSVNVTRSTDLAEINFQLNSSIIDNADIAANAAISQSKLNLNRAGTLPSTTTNPTQEQCGVSVFDEGQFTSNNGFIQLRSASSSATGIPLEKLQHVTAGHLLGRSGTDGSVSLIPFASVSSATGGIIREDFPTRYSSGTDVLIRTGGSPSDASVDTFNTQQIAIDESGNTIVARNTDGDITARRFILKDYLQYKDSAGIIRNLFSAQGEGEANFDDVIGSNGSTLGAGSNTQINSSYTTGFVASKWNYTKGIEAFDRGGNGGSGVGMVFGAGTGFSESTNTNIVLFSNGAPTFSIDSAGLFIAGSGSRNIGTSSRKFDTVYATTFDGTATKAYYADLAENYVGDADYEPGTVVVFGGMKEVTHSSMPNDKRVAGVVSTNPAHLMNSELEAEHVVAVALQGRVPCKVVGLVSPGDMIVASDTPGHGIANPDPKLGTVIGKAVKGKATDGEGIIEIVVGRL